MMFENQSMDDGIAADWHPSEKTHEKAAEKLRDEAEPNREAAISAAMNILMGRK